VSNPASVRVMGQIIALTRILNLLASIRHDGDPTIGELLAAVPDLQKMDWINRFGPVRAWERVASDIQTDALEWLTKALVIAEREFDWVGGSVAAPIWLYRTYSTRVGGDPNALAEWIVRNRGRNEYLPFGSRTSARSLEEWHTEQEMRQLYREELRLVQEQQKKEKIERKQRAIERVTQRKHESRERHAHIERQLVELRAVQGCQRLSLIARDTSLPLEKIPPSLIVECIDAVQVLDEETKQTLLRRIDRRRRRVWKNLRSALVC
jgi:hypothetical protein